MNEETVSADGTAAAELARRARCDFSRIGLALFFMGVLTTVLQLVFSLLPGLWPGCADNRWYLWLATFVPLYLVGMPAAALLMRRVPADTLEKKKMHPGNFFVVFAMCMGILYTGSILGTLLSTLFTRGGAHNPLEDYVSQTTVLSVLIAVVLAPILEELVFRKLLIDRLARYGGALAVVTSGLCFGLFHMNLYQFFYAAGLGMLFGYLYLRTGKILYTIVLHMLVNFMGSVVSVFMSNLVDQSVLSGLDYSDPQAVMDAILPQLPQVLAVEAYALVLLGLVIGGIAVLICARKKFVFPPAPQQLAHGGRIAFCNIGMLLFFALCLCILVLNLAAAYF
jgi:membrane protease YdiL (CAAX protease family)